MSQRPTADEVIGYHDSLSNWDRWGHDDLRGTLNLITPDVRMRAFGLVETGDVVSLSRDIDPENPDPLGSGIARALRFMNVDEVAHHVGKGVTRFDAVTETVLISAHGSNTHLETSAHYSWDRKNYNGYDVSDTTTCMGGTRLSIHLASSGVFTRGVLLDICALKGVDWLEPGYPIMPDDVEAAEQRQGVRVSPGDVLLVHTGHVRRTLSQGLVGDPRNPRIAGLHAACLPFLRDRDVAVLGSDAIQDVQPSGYDSFDLFRPVHTFGMTALGLWFIDNAELTELAAKCARIGRWEFLFACLPWRFIGVTASATNPVAIF